ncbi:MAG: helix-turn-helix domain-containing protein, partial [Gemmatimonadaceae bacterium]|nr:helix-turn-helix domain-containing protein [Gemmatimonadaceae bacterium]
MSFDYPLRSEKTMPAPARKWHVGKALKDIIDEGRTTEEEAAKKLGVSRVTLDRWFSAPELPLRIAERISPLLGIRHEWLMSGRGEKLLHVDSEPARPWHAGQALKEIIGEGRTHRPGAA